MYRSYLHLNIKNADPSALRNVLDGLHTGPVVIPPELRVLDEPVPRHEVEKVFFGRVVVFAAMLLAGPRGARGV